MGEIAKHGVNTKTNKGLGYAILFFCSVIIIGFASEACGRERPDSGRCDDGRIIFLIVASVVSTLVVIPWIVAFIFDVSFLIKIELVGILFLFALWGCIAGVLSDKEDIIILNDVPLGFAWLGFIITFILLYLCITTRGGEKKKKEEAPAEEKAKEEPAEPEKKEEAAAAAV